MRGNRLVAALGVGNAFRIYDEKIKTAGDAVLV
jgi:hypothetical protein